MAVSVVSIACLLAGLPGPPGFRYNEAYIQALPVWKGNSLCPDIEVSTDMSFLLYTRENGGTAEYLEVGNERLLTASTFDPGRQTVIYIHGYLELAQAFSSQVIKEAYMSRGEHNIILVDYKRLAAGPWYVTAVGNSVAVGRYVALFIDQLVSRGLRLSSLHVVGLSLGAHVAGQVGRNIRSGRLSRITGLDPAGPVFDLLPQEYRLDQSCADFVDVIHSDRAVFGVSSPAGHADFYPNGGRHPQPGCTQQAVADRDGSPNEKIFCSHWRSYLYYAESVMNPTAFPALSCGGGRNFDVDNCHQSDVTDVYMGYSTPNTARGFYFTQTGDSPPYSKQGHMLY